MSIFASEQGRTGLAQRRPFQMLQTRFSSRGRNTSAEHSSERRGPFVDGNQAEGQDKGSAVAAARKARSAFAAVGSFRFQLNQPLGPPAHWVTFLPLLTKHHQPTNLGFSSLFLLRCRLLCGVGVQHTRRIYLNMLPGILLSQDRMVDNRQESPEKAVTTRRLLYLAR